MEDHDENAASYGCYGEVAHLARRKFTACINNFDMGDMDLGARNLKFFWRRHDKWLVFFERISSVLGRYLPWLCGRLLVDAFRKELILIPLKWYKKYINLLDLG